MATKMRPERSLKHETTPVNPRIKTHETMNQDHASVWARCLEVIGDNISASVQTWFAPIKPVKLGEMF